MYFKKILKLKQSLIFIKKNKEYNKNCILNFFFYSKKWNKKTLNNNYWNIKNIINVHWYK